MAEQLKALASGFLRQAGDYADLVAADLAATGRSAAQRLWAAVALVAALVLVLQLGCVLVITAAWDTPQRGLAVGALFGLFVVLALTAAFLLSRLHARRPRLLSSTAARWQGDRALLAERLAPASGRAAAPADNAFPRSQTFRWLMAKPVRGWLGSALLTGALARLPVGRVLAGWVFGRKR